MKEDTLEDIMYYVLGLVIFATNDMFTLVEDPPTNEVT